MNSSLPESLPSIHVLAGNRPPLFKQEMENERRLLKEFRSLLNYVYIEFQEKDLECKIGSSMTRFYDMATDECLSCEENKNLSYDFCTVQDQIRRNEKEIFLFSKIYRNQTYNLNKEATIENENLLNDYKTLFISMVIVNLIVLIVVTGVGFILYKKIKTKKKTTRHKETRKASSSHLKIERKSIRSSSKDDVNIYNN